MKAVVAAFNQEKDLLRDYEPSDGTFSSTTEDAINAEIQEMFNREKEHKLLQKRIKHGLNLS